MTDMKNTPCPECGGPANHPVGSSACKRIRIQRKPSFMESVSRVVTDDEDAWKLEVIKQIERTAALIEDTE